MKLKLAKQAKKEPRKASFPWDIGFLFVQPIKYALIFHNIEIYNRKLNYRNSKLRIFTKNACNNMVILARSLEIELMCKTKLRSRLWKGSY